MPPGPARPHSFACTHSSPFIPIHTHSSTFTPIHPTPQSHSIHQALPPAGCDWPKITLHLARAPNHRHHSQLPSLGRGLDADARLPPSRARTLGGSSRAAAGRGVPERMGALPAPPRDALLCGWLARAFCARHCQAPRGRSARVPALYSGVYTQREPARCTMPFHGALDVTSAVCRVGDRLGQHGSSPTWNWAGWNPHLAPLGRFGGARRGARWRAKPSHMLMGRLHWVNSRLMSCNPGARREKTRGHRLPQQNAPITPRALQAPLKIPKASI